MKIALKYGVIIGISIAFWEMINYFFLFQYISGKINFFIDLFILVIFIRKGIADIKIIKYNGLITFGNASLAGIQITIIASVLLASITFGYFSIGNKNYENFYITETIKVMKEHKMQGQKDTIDKLTISFKPINQTKSAFVITLLIGTVVSFIFGMIFRNTLPEPILNS